MESQIIELCVTNQFRCKSSIGLLSQVFLVSLKASIQLSIKFYKKLYRRHTIVVFLVYTEVVIFTKDKGPIICMFFIIEVQIVKGKGH